MDAHKKREQLLHKYLSGTCTPEERLQVEQWYRQLDLPGELPSMEQMENDLADVRERLPRKRAHRLAPWYRYVAAAAIAAVMAIGVYVYFFQSEWSGTESEVAATSLPDDLAPGGNRAILQLADGTEIVLDERPDGTVAQEGEHAIYKHADGELVYQLEASGADREVPVFNRLQTPRGGQYHLVLPDGTHVWLNAASTLTYAISGATQERLVQLEGEAYFEVAGDPDRPFRVASRGQMVEVLGTHFNVNSYPDEPLIRTTLVEGAVKVSGSTDQRPVVLAPGEQALWAEDNQLAIRKVDVAQAVAWKNGKFNFSHSDVATVMRELSRWYNVDVVFEGEKPDITLSGEVYRNTNASNVLDILAFYDLDCRIVNQQGVKQIIVRKK
ncbi:FecR family protein [Parapedobacter indicus]|uniref:FecR family protein n=1 Tax=Parapedobacter indicus TaxID=1477437 RepID=A0A1I3GLX1_9SPHI|nr:FecR family protein [Parapedobacter indicus]PPL02702.1 FecR family protein [Parapedobacter indicus]SFI24406.1 FecR family protein [Parapedobacter indicus]